MNEEVKYEEYVYIGAPLPDGCPIDTKQGIHTKNGIYPHRWGLKVGEDSREFGKNSYLTIDQENNNTAMLDKLIAAGTTKEYSRSISRKVKNDDGKTVWKDALLTTYYLPYERASASFRIPTTQEPIENAVNVQTDALLEVLFVTGDEGWSRYVEIPIQTAWPSVSMMDVIEDLQDIFVDWAQEKKNGFEFFSFDDVEYDNETEGDPDFENDFDDEDEDYEDGDDSQHPMMVLFFNEAGDGSQLEFENVSELMHCIVSLRLVAVQNEIVERHHTAQ